MSSPCCLSGRLRKEQAGYRKGRGTTDHCIEVNGFRKKLLIPFTEKFMGDYGDVWNSGKIVKMVKVFYNGFKCAVVNAE